jgi:addiction module HigA family antidote
MVNSKRKLIPAPPINPGQVLRKFILAGCQITQYELATAMRVSRFSINQIMNGRRAVTAEMAMRLARVTSTTAEFWLNLQRDIDLYEARLELGKTIEELKVLRKPKSDKELFGPRIS